MGAPEPVTEMRPGGLGIGRDRHEPDEALREALAFALDTEGYWARAFAEVSAGE